MRAGLLLTAYPRLAEQFDPVPAAYFDHDGIRAIVECPCGRRPVLERGELRACEAARCWVPGVRSECARSFIATNRAVLVFNAARAT